AQLSHPNIVQIYELGQEADSYFIAMEYVAGEDMERILYTAAERSQTVPIKFAVRIMAWVCEALYYAHRQVDLNGRALNIVHRDVTPGNVMVSYQGNVKLVDFGIAKATAQLERTRPGVVKGKFLYMAPEQILQLEIDHRA